MDSENSLKCIVKCLIWHHFISPLSVPFKRNTKHMFDVSMSKISILTFTLLTRSNFPNTLFNIKWSSPWHWVAYLNTIQINVVPIHNLIKIKEVKHELCLNNFGFKIARLCVLCPSITRLAGSLFNSFYWGATWSYIPFYSSRCKGMII